MAEVCRDIDQGLAALTSKIDAQNKRLRELEQKINKCCNNSDSNNNNNNNDSLEKRVKKLEKYIESLEQGLIVVVSAVKKIQTIFKGLFQ